MRFRIVYMYLVIFMGVISSHALASQPVQNFIFIGGDGTNISKYQKYIDDPSIVGVQVSYSWKLLQPAKGIYNFQPIQYDLDYLTAHHKKLFIQIQDRFFMPNAKNIPAYLMSDPIYGGGIVPQMDNSGENKAQVEGWVAMQWNMNVREQYQSLLQALAKEYDGKIYGINLPETAIDVVNTKQNGFSNSGYFQAEIDNMLAAKRFFKKSVVVQYVNFFPGEWDNVKGYMSTLFSTAIANGVGLGGPDVVPYKNGQMHNSYPFFNRYHTKLDVVAMAIQLPDYTYIIQTRKNRLQKQN